MGFTGTRTPVADSLQARKRDEAPLVEPDRDEPPHDKLAAERRLPLKLSPKELMGLAWREEHRLSAEEHECFAALNARLPLLSVARDCAIHRALVLTFRALLREKRVQDVEGWLERAKTSKVHDLGLFAASLERERGALDAAIRLPLSNGPVEGLVHKVKLIKRLIYGRASFPLLRARILLATPLHRG